MYDNVDDIRVYEDYLEPDNDTGATVYNYQKYDICDPRIA